MTPEEYMKLAARTDSGNTNIPPIILWSDSLLGVLNASMGLAGESGELLDYIKKVLFQGKEIEPWRIEEELGDILWYFAKFCRVMNLNFEQIMEKNIAKLEQRYPTNTFRVKDSEQRDYTAEEAAANGDKPAI